MSNDGVNAGRRRFLVAATSVVGAAGAVGAAVPFVGSWFPSAKAKAAGAPVKVNVSKIEPGQQMIAEWRGQPVFIVRRTEEILGNLKRSKASCLTRHPKIPISPPTPRTKCVRSSQRSCCWLVCVHTWVARLPSARKWPLSIWARIGSVVISAPATARTTTSLAVSTNPSLLH